MSNVAAAVLRSEPETAAPKPEIRRLEAGQIVVRDGWIRLLGIPAFGIVIPNLTGLFGPVPTFSRLYWAGYLLFVTLSGLIWQGNRFVMVEQRRHWDWFDHPWRKVALLLASNVLWTAPVSVGLLLAWYRLADARADWAAIRLVALANVVCVMFITHVYETVHLIRQREDDLLRLARLEQARAEAELAALKAQVDPHFLFNSLNTLVHVIPRDPLAAIAFTERLADAYRYILASGSRDLVPLADELAFARDYVELLRLRFSDTVVLEIDGGDERRLVPPVALQVLVENAVKHNAFDARRPLVIRVDIGPEGLRVSNVVRARLSGRPGAGLGLRNLDERCRRVLGHALVVREGREFVVEVPLAVVRS